MGSSWVCAFFILGFNEEILKKNLIWADYEEYYCTDLIFGFIYTKVFSNTRPLQKTGSG